MSLLAAFNSRDGISAATAANPDDILASGLSFSRGSVSLSSHSAARPVPRSFVSHQNSHQSTSSDVPTQAETSERSPGSQQQLPPQPAASGDLAFGSAIPLNVVSRSGGEGSLSMLDGIAPSMIVLNSNIPDCVPADDYGGGGLDSADAMLDNLDALTALPNQSHAAGARTLSVPNMINMRSAALRADDGVRSSPSASELESEAGSSPQPNKSRPSSRLTKLSGAPPYRSASGLPLGSASEALYKLGGSSSIGTSAFSRFQLQVPIGAPAADDVGGRLGGKSSPSIPEGVDADFSVGSSKVGPKSLSGARQLTSQATAPYAGNQSFGQTAFTRHSSHISQVSCSSTLLARPTRTRSVGSAEGLLVIGGSKRVSGPPEASDNSEQLRGRPSPLQLSAEAQGSDNLRLLQWQQQQRMETEYAGQWEELEDESSEEEHGPEPGSGGEEDAGAGGGETRWHEVQAVPVRDPVTGKEVSAGIFIMEGGG